GNTIWESTLGGSKGETGYSVTSSPDGGYVAVGGTSSFGGTSYDVYIVKALQSGIQSWQKSCGSENVDKAMSIAATPDGGYIIGARTLNPASSGDYYLLKVDAYGDL
ncbi:MAG: hypothetical protein KJ723_15515, partial [candidate division Zixibacteria bacterium]|nr:hypothetical protein [candidate division Zixibacteria bacterium]